MRMLLFLLKNVKCTFRISSCAIPKLLITPVAANNGLDVVNMIAFLSISKKLSAAVLQFSLLLLLLQALQVHSVNVVAFSTYNFHLSRSWTQLVQFFIFGFFKSFVTSYSRLFFGLPCGRVNIVFLLYTFYLPFSLPAFDVNGQMAKPA